MFMNTSIFGTKLSKNNVCLFYFIHIFIQKGRGYILSLQQNVRYCDGGEKGEYNFRKLDEKEEKFSYLVRF